MTNPSTSGHDGPYPAPIVVTDRKVERDWIDANGHMNVGYYGIAFDLASDVLMEDHLGVGWDYVERYGQGSFVLQAHTQFLNELREGETFSVRFRLIDHDRKRLHLFAEMVRDADGALCATQETLSMNVDHHSRRSAEYPDWAIARFARMKADHAGLEPPAQLGAAIGIRRKG